MYFQPIAGKSVLHSMHLSYLQKSSVDFSKHHLHIASDESHCCANELFRLMYTTRIVRLLSSTVSNILYASDTKSILNGIFDGTLISIACCKPYNEAT